MNTYKKDNARAKPDIDQPQDSLGVSDDLWRAKARIALRRGMLEGGEVNESVIAEIQQALHANKTSAQAALAHELASLPWQFCDIAVSTLLRVDTKTFIASTAHHLLQTDSCTTLVRTEAQLRRSIHDEEVITCILDSLLDPRNRFRAAMNGLKAPHKMLLGVVAQRIDAPRVRWALLEIASNPACSEERSAAEQALSPAAIYPEVASYFADSVIKQRSVSYGLDKVELLLTAPLLPNVISVLALNVNNSKHADTILERLATCLEFPEARRALVKVIISAEWQSRVFVHRHPEARRATAIRSFDTGLNGAMGDLLAATLIDQLEADEVTRQSFEGPLLELLQARIESQPIQRALVKGLSSESTHAAMRCAELLSKISERPAIRALLREIALGETGAAGHTALLLLTDCFSPSVHAPRWRIGDRDFSRAPALDPCGTPWE